MASLVMNAPDIAMLPSSTATPTARSTFFWLGLGIGIGVNSDDGVETLFVRDGVVSYRVVELMALINLAVVCEVNIVAFVVSDVADTVLLGY